MRDFFAVTRVSAQCLGSSSEVAWRGGVSRPRLIRAEMIF